MEKITKKNFYQALINYANGEGFKVEIAEGEVREITADEIVAFAENEIGLIQKKNEKAKESAAKKKAEADVLKDLVADALSDEFEPISEIAARVDFEDATVSKVTARLTKLVKEGVAEKQAIKIEGSDGKKNRTVQGYRRCDVTVED